MRFGSGIYFEKQVSLLCACGLAVGVGVLHAVCHPLSGGSVACLVCASPHFTQATAPYARSLSVSVLPFSAMPFSVWQFTFTAKRKKRDQ